MGEEDAAYIIRQILSAITYCHSKGVVHRDLKPENILIDSSSEGGKMNIKIIDFGTALFFTPEVKLRGTMGTPYYIAPEVLLGNYTEKCDVWSIGVILFVLLSGTAPFNGATDDDILTSVKTGKYAFRSTYFSSLCRQNLGERLFLCQGLNKEAADIQPRRTNIGSRCV